MALETDILGMDPIDTPLSLPDDLLHFYQPNKTGEKDGKGTLQQLADILDVNTSFANIPYLDKVNTFTQKNNFPSLNIGGNPTPTYALEVYDCLVASSMRVQSGGAFNASCRLENITNKWSIIAIGSSGNLAFRDETAVIDVAVFEAGAPTNSDYTDASGRKGWGRAPTTSYDFFRATENIIALIETAIVNGSVQLQLKNDAQTWATQIGSDDTYSIRDVTNSKQPFFAEPNTPTDTLYLAAPGNVIIGGNSPITSVSLQVEGTGVIYLKPITTTQRNALTPTNGMGIYNSTTNQFEKYQAGSWQAW